MLVPAICYKSEIENAFKQYYYTTDMMYYMGYMGNGTISIVESDDGDHFQYAVIDSDRKLIGYITYAVDNYSSCAYNVAAFSFDRGNPIMGKEMYNIMEKLINKYHNVTFKVVSGNPAVKGYDRFLEKHKDIGTKITFRDVFKDGDGNYHNCYTYEFINDKIK